MALQTRESISDNERTAVAEQLAAHVGRGVLDISEYDRRVTDVYAATSHDELAAVVSDLPQPAPRRRTTPPKSAWTRSIWLPYIGVNVLCVAIWAITCIGTLSLVYPWPIWVAGPWGLALALGAVTGFPLGGKTCMLPRVSRL